MRYTYEKQDKRQAWHTVNSCDELDFALRGTLRFEKVGWYLQSECKIIKFRHGNHAFISQTLQQSWEWFHVDCNVESLPSAETLHNNQESWMWLPYRKLQRGRNTWHNY